MRILKIWLLAQLINIIPFLYFLNESEGFVIIAVIFAFSFIGGIAVLVAFGVWDTIIVNNKFSATSSFYLSLVLLPVITAIGSFGVGYVFSRDFDDLLPFEMMPVVATFLAVLICRKSYLPGHTEIEFQTEESVPDMIQ